MGINRYGFQLLHSIGYAVVLPSRACLFTLGSPQTAVATIDVFDLRGQLIQAITVLSNASRVLWNSKRLSPGTYLARLRTNTITTSVVCIHRQ